MYANWIKQLLLCKGIIMYEIVKMALSVGIPCSPLAVMTMF